MANKLLGGSQAQLSRGDFLANKGVMGNVRAPGGGFKDSPLAGSLLNAQTQSSLFVDKAQVGITQTPPITDDMVVKSIAIVSVESTATPVVTESGGGSPGGGDGSGAGDGGGGDGGSGSGGGPGGGGDGSGPGGDGGQGAE